MASWSKTQATTSLSSCESELQALTYAATEALHIRHLLNDAMSTTTFKIVLLCDSLSTLSLVQKRGVGRVRHLRAKELWLQEALRDGKFVVQKVASRDNIADLFTKHLTPKSFRRVSQALGIEFVAGS